MNSTLHSFHSIFDYTYVENGKETQLNKIIIPILQRDYAQGRPNEKRVRDRFLKSLYGAITNEPIVLDFIYGDIQNGIMTPLDGQQRLTTLFLLYWFAAIKGKISTDKYSFLNKFSYETRPSARDFCEKLVGFIPTKLESISSQIEDQYWFPLSWKNDPTVASMLLMIDSISNTFSGINNLWEKLHKGCIQFYFLPISDMGLTDELYIKMNSRGKPLSSFEHYKAELEQELSTSDKDKAKDISRKIDNQWTDLLWAYRDNKNTVGDDFLRYFRFICDVIRYESNDTPQGKTTDELDLVTECFGRDNEQATQNIQKMESFFNCWIQFTSPKEFFIKLLSDVSTNGKVKIKEKTSDLFKDCIKNYGTSTFSLNKVVLLYACIIYLSEGKDIPFDQFVQRFRTINNLVMNSLDEMSDSVSRIGGNRMPAILRQTKSVILKGTILETGTIGINFNNHQLEEERNKIVWLEKNEDKRELLYKAEDHELLFGQIGIIGLENIVLIDKFYNLFECNRDLIDIALLAQGDYSQIHRGWRMQLGAGGTLDVPWVKLFHKSNMEGFQKTKQVILALLNSLDTINSDSLQIFVREFIDNCESAHVYDWRYYYIKYPAFRPRKYGLYWLMDKTGRNKYELCTIVTREKVSENSFQPFLKSLDLGLLLKDRYGTVLEFGTFCMEAQASSYIIKKSENEDDLLAKIDINQNDDGFDTENRIEKIRNILLNEYLAD